MNKKKTLLLLLLLCTFFACQKREPVFTLHRDLHKDMVNYSYVILVENAPRDTMELKRLMIYHFLHLVLVENIEQADLGFAVGAEFFKSTRATRRRFIDNAEVERWGRSSYFTRGGRNSWRWYNNRTLIGWIGIRSCDEAPTKTLARMSINVCTCDYAFMQGRPDTKRIILLDECNPAWYVMHSSWLTADRNNKIVPYFMELWHSINDISADAKVVVPDTLEGICETATFDEGVVINGVRWATRNVDMPGTFAETPECFGMFYQWNSNRAWNVTDDKIENFENASATSRTWDIRNDPCPRGWRVPTLGELQSLRRAGSEWITQNGTLGRLYGVAPYQIFLPAVGRRDENGVLHCVEWTWAGYYWSRNGLRNNIAAQVLLFGSGTLSAVCHRLKTNGMSVRCVAIIPNK